MPGAPPDGAVTNDGQGPQISVSMDRSMDAGADARIAPRPRLANRLDIERQCDLDRDAQLAALRVALGLPRVLPSQREAA